MNKAVNIILQVALIGFLGLNIYALSPQPKNDFKLGSMDEANYSTTTDSTWNQATKFKVLKTGPGKLDSVVVSGATLAAALNFYDGTTTAAHSNHPTTTIGAIFASTPAGTYTFDAAFTRGLIVEFPTAIGPASSTITWD